MEPTEILVAEKQITFHEKHAARGKMTDLDKNLYLIKFLRFSKWGNFWFNFLTIFPFPFLVTFLNYIFKQRIYVKLAYDSAESIDSATHVLLLKTVEDSIEVLRIKKKKLFMGSKQSDTFLTFTFNNQRFIYEDKSKTFVSLHKRFIHEKLEKFVKNYRYGLKEKNCRALVNTWGENSMSLHYHSIRDMIFDEMTSVLGIFEIISYLLVCYESSVFSLYSMLILFFFSNGMVGQIQNELVAQEKIRYMAETHSSVIVVRENSDKTFTKKIMDIASLLPGDLIEVIANMPVPADCVLVNGECVMQESMLTGESTPILKTSYMVDKNEGKLSQKNQKANKIIPRNMLHCGSEILYTKGSLSESMLAVVTATGFYTKKGSVVQTMVKPTKKSYKFYDDAADFLLILFMLASFSTICYIIYKVYLEEGGMGYDVTGMFLQIYDMFVTISKPSIPICLIAGLELSVESLTGQGISVLNKFNLSEAAWMSTICFDKTGTLTEDYMTTQGFIPTRKVLEVIQAVNEKLDEEELEEIQNEEIEEKTQIIVNFAKLSKRVTTKMMNPSNAMLLECFGLCNSLLKIGKKLVGDPIEVEMFHNSVFDMKYLPKFHLDPKHHLDELDSKEMWKYFVPNKEAYPAVNQRFYRQEKVFDFTNKNKRMTVVNSKYPFFEKLLRSYQKSKNKVIINDLEDLDYVYVSCKGAPETIYKLCEDKTIPDDYEERNDLLGSKGLKVLAMAGKKIKLNIFNKSEFNKGSLTDEDYQKEFSGEDLAKLEKIIRARDSAIDDLVIDEEQEFFEDNLIFIGFYLMENPLKEGAEAVLSVLEKNFISTKIVTGDNLFTGLNVAKTVGIMPKDRPIYMSETIQEGKTNVVKWIEMSSYFSKDDLNESEGSNYFSLSQIRQSFLETIAEEKAQRLLKLEESKKPVEDLNSDHYSEQLDDISNPETEMSQGQNNYESSEDSVSAIDEEFEHQLRRNKDDLNNTEGKIWANGPSLIISGKDFDLMITQILDIHDMSILNESGGLKACLDEVTLDPSVISDLYYFAHSSKVFGRCNSDQKTRIITLLKTFKLDPDSTLGFVGDGTNDLQAIKNSDTALKLGKTDLSGSTSFVSENGDLRSVLTLINESKASLSNGYHNFSFMIFFISMQFVGLVHLYIAEITYNVMQLIIIDFALLNLFGLYVPTIQSRKKMSMFTPKKSIWHRKLSIFLIGQIIAGTCLMTYGYFLIKSSDYYVSPRNIISAEDIEHGHVELDSYKFIDNHYLFLMVWNFSLIFLAVDNVEDHFRKSYFASFQRTVAFIFMTVLGLGLLITPIMDIKNNPLLIFLSYVFRIRIIFSQEHLIVTISTLLGSTIVFFIVSLILKFMSQMIHGKKDSRDLFETELGQKLLDHISD